MELDFNFWKTSASEKEGWAVCVRVHCHSRCRTQRAAICLPMDGDGSGLGKAMTSHLCNLDPDVPRQHRSVKCKVIYISFRQTRRLKLLCNLNQQNWINSRVLKSWAARPGRAYVHCYMEFICTYSISYGWLHTSKYPDVRLVKILMRVMSLLAWVGRPIWTFLRLVIASRSYSRYSLQP